MRYADRFIRLGAGLVRGLVVALATLAILLVCFSIYQYSQLGINSSSPSVGPRLPSAPTQASAEPEAPDPTGPRVSVGGGSVGPGRNIKLMIYPREGTRARFEIAVSSYTPVDGATDELLLHDPEIRLRTTEGNAVRVTAKKGLLEARRQGGAIDPQRGRLSGEVVIEIDRLSERQRSALLPEHRDRVDSDQLVRIEASEIEFDMEYSKIKVPGSMRLSARDVEFDASGLELRFNDAENRIEELRVEAGGRLVLLEPKRNLDLSMPDWDTGPGRPQTIVEWMRATIQSKLPMGATLAATAAAPRQADRPSNLLPSESLDGPLGKNLPPAPLRKTAEEGLGAPPVFGSVDKSGPRTKPALNYFARFEEDVAATQDVDGTTRARLDADLLEIVRAFSPEERARVWSQPADAEPLSRQKNRATVSPTERIVLTWAGRLVVHPVSPEIGPKLDDAQSTVTTTGSPVQLSTPEGEAACARMVFEPGRSAVRLFAGADAPLSVRSGRQGVITGQEASFQRTKDEMFVSVTGPGRLVRDTDAGGNVPKASSEGASGGPSTIEFRQSLEAQGRFVQRTSFALAGGLSSGEHRVLDRATFHGGVKLHENDTSVEADELTAEFRETSGTFDRHDRVERVTARGQVKMVREDDLVTGRQIDVVFTPDSQGRAVPTTAVVIGDVVAEQGERIIRAREKLMVEFAAAAQATPPFDVEHARAQALQQGLDPAAIDWDARRREHENRRRSQVTARRIQGTGEVSVIDPRQSLTLSAEEFDCSVSDGREIETAVLTGRADRPADVRLDTFSVQGHIIHLNVPDQWMEVPGAGRLSFVSKKDLDGRKLSDPVLITVEWSDWMKYQGRENRAVFAGRVHASGGSDATFDCPQMVIEFQDVPPPTRDTKPELDWWVLQEAVDRLSGRKAADRAAPAPIRERFAKEPAAILATGGVVARVAQRQLGSGILQSRSRISGPKLSMNLRDEASKLLIEGPGNLLLEDFRPTQFSDSAPPARDGLFGIQMGSGESKTLIEWQELMWYDFSISQTRFEGDVELKHFSGAELQRLVQTAVSDKTDSAPGRSTFLACRLLTVDFQRGTDGAGVQDNNRMGGLSADRLRQFQAAGSVRLQDQMEGLWVAAETILYDKERSLLSVYGGGQNKAQIVIQKPSAFPQTHSASRFFYNLTTHAVEGSEPNFAGR